VLVLASCAPASAEVANTVRTPGFWLGLWHGLITPVTFIVSLFNDEVGIYAVRNSGGWYDAGFMIGVSTVVSSTARGGRGASGSRRSQRGTAE